MKYSLDCVSILMDRKTEMTLLDIYEEKPINNIM